MHEVQSSTFELKKRYSRGTFDLANNLIGYTNRDVQSDYSVSDTALWTGLTRRSAHTTCRIALYVHIYLY